jgi:segregation and condensation protein B
MDYFGINNINDLPQIKDFTDNTASIGEHAE